VPVDLLVGSPVASVLVLYPRALALGTGGAESLVWSVWRPVMPPGATARRISQALGQLWLATDRGLLQAEDPRLGWDRTANPAGWLPTFATAGSADRLFSATQDGVLRAERGALAPSRRGPIPVVAGAPTRARPPPEPGPEVERVHRMAMAHLGLDVDRQRGLRERAARRSWWPELDVSIGYGGDHSERYDYDESFVSGDTRRLFDRNRNRGSDWDADLSLSWDLAAAVFDPEVIDLAREQRAWISLRDDVLDEINLLYFERRRVLLDLAALPDATSIDAERLRLRAGELAAGLDSWTGGGFSRERSER